MSKDYMWLSFADGDLPEGKQFLGGIVVEGEDIIQATLRTHWLKLNPGGEVMGWGPFKKSDINPLYPVEKLLSKRTIARLDKQASKPKREVPK